MKFFREMVRILLSPISKDIGSNLKSRLDSYTDPNAMDDELRVDIMSIILEKI